MTSDGPQGSAQRLDLDSVRECISSSCSHRRALATLELFECRNPLLCLVPDYLGFRSTRRLKNAAVSCAGVTVQSRQPAASTKHLAFRFQRLNLIMSR